MANGALRVESAWFNGAVAALPINLTTEVQLEHILARLDRRQLECFVETAINLLDTMDGDADQEDGDEDCCEARDDTGGIVSGPEYCSAFEPGDPDDEEDDEFWAVERAQRRLNARAVPPLIFR